MRVSIALALVLGFLAGCDDGPAPLPDLGAAPDMDETFPDLALPDLIVPIEFEDFVLGLIQTQTADNTAPTTTEDKAFVDSMDPTKFTSLF